MRRRNRQTGFALILVLMALVMASILGLSYVSTASIKLAGSSNLSRASRAKYLAESGLQHALYMLKVNKDAMAASSANSQLGPYYIDNSSDSYRFYAIVDPADPTIYYLFAEATSGGVKQTASMKVRRLDARKTVTTHSMLVGGNVAWLPSTLVVNGDFHINGHLLNWAAINGDASASGIVWDPNRKIKGTSTQYADPKEMPGITWSQYVSYKLDGVTYSAEQYKNTEIKKGGSITSGKAVTASNPGGVIYLKPKSGSTVTIQKDVEFTGTLIIDGNLVLDGSNIHLEAVEGYPAIVASGTIYVTNNARNVTIDGLVRSWGGLAAYGTTSGSSTEINGALISDYYGYDLNLSGSHVLNYEEDRCGLYDITGGSTGGASVQILETADN